jgi:hypothetical protein
MDWKQLSNDNIKFSAFSSWKMYKIEDADVGALRMLWTKLGGIEWGIGREKIEYGEFGEGGGGGFD